MAIKTANDIVEKYDITIKQLEALCKLLQDEKFANIVTIYQSLTNLRKERFYNYAILIIEAMGLDLEKIIQNK